MKILIKFPTRGRPNKFLQTLSQYQHQRTTDMVHFLITIDEDDRTMNNHQMIRSMQMWGNLSYNVVPAPGGKIKAINYGLAEVVDNYDIILLASDDMIPVVKGYDQTIMETMSRMFPDTDGVLWFNDGFRGMGTEHPLNTLCILGRSYYKRFGYIYHPDYKALWCDNEFMDVANQLGRQFYVDEVIIRHEHPINVNTRHDNLNSRDNKLYDEDQRIYQTRKASNFYLIDIDTDINGPDTDVREADGGIGETNSKKRGRKKRSDSIDKG